MIPCVSYADIKATQRLTADEWFEKSLTLMKEDSGYYTDPNQALDYLTKAISLESGIAKFHNNRGLAYNQLGKYQQAIEDFDQAINLDPKNADVYHNRGIAYTRLGKFQEAIEDFNQAVHLDPKDAAAYNNRGVCYHSLSQRENACRDWRKACELGNCSGMNWAINKGFCQKQNTR